LEKDLLDLIVLLTAPYKKPPMMDDKGNARDGGYGNGAMCYELALEYYNILGNIYKKQNKFSKVFELISKQDKLAKTMLEDKKLSDVVCVYYEFKFSNHGCEPEPKIYTGI